MSEEEPNPPAPFPKKEGGTEQNQSSVNEEELHVPPATPSSEGGAAALAPPSFLGKGAGGLGSPGALLGIDYGTKRIGLAVCDPDRVIASPLDTAPNDFSKEAYFRALFAKSKFVGIVVGLPLHTSGEESPMSEEARKFAAWLAELVKLPVVMWDERYTSFAAEDMLLEAKLTKKKRKARVDRVAAQMILQTFIDAGSPADTHNTILPK